MTENSTPGYTSYASTAATRTNTVAIVSLAFAFLAAPIGVICGFMALSQIRRTGERGRALAIAGIIAGFAVAAFWLLMWGILAALVSVAPATSSL